MIRDRAPLDVHDLPFGVVGAGRGIWCTWGVYFMPRPAR